MTAAQHGHGGGQPAGLHVATIAHAGLLWDAYLELADDPRRPESFRGRLRFERAGPDGAALTAQTGVIIIEDSYEEAVARVRRMDDRQLEGLLRSALPDA
ncbi:MAG TPA: hypothetical protein VMM35_03480 [Longimicrobiales bacterium]|nr:hypothetical protein [Longimicrobiales bacterium]